MKNGKEIIQTWFQRVWSEEDQLAIDEMYAGGKIRGLGSQTVLGQEEFKQFHNALCALLSDIVITVDKCIEDDGWASALCTLNAKSKSSGDTVNISGNVWFRIEDGKIQEAYNHFDFIGLWGQLGYLPIDSFEQGLQGNKIV